MRYTKDIVMEAVEENGLSREDLVRLMGNIFAHPGKPKLLYVYASSDRPSKDRKIKKLIRRLIELGLVSEEKDMRKDRLALTSAGLEYLKKLRGYDG